MQVDKMTSNILFCGTGGQGVLKAAEVCSVAAMLQGFHVKKSEVHGMAQRGGSVESHVRFGNIVYSPLIAKGDVDFLISFDMGEHDRMIGFLKKNGQDLVSHLPDAIKEKKFINTYLLGVLSKHLDIKESNWLNAFKLVFDGKFFEENKAVFLKGRGEKS